MQPGGVFRQSRITRLAVAEQVLQHLKRMLDLCTHTGLGAFQLFFDPAERLLLDRFAHAALHRDVPGHRLACVLRALVGTLISSVTEHYRFVAMCQVSRGHKRA